SPLIQTYTQFSILANTSKWPAFSDWRQCFRYLYKTGNLTAGFVMNARFNANDGSLGLPSIIVDTI
ncbi:hypothetical protein A3Q56_02431, partial [Intoshia linei]